MKIGTCLMAIAAVIASGTVSMASPYETDGDKAAQFGTTVYNGLNPSKPLPVSRGDVLQDTARNMGKGQSPGDAWSNAARSNSGQ